MSENLCPAADVLEAFVLGTLPRTVLDSLAGHLEGCAVCEAALKTLEERSDDLIQGLRGLEPVGSLQDSTLDTLAGAAPLPRPAPASGASAAWLAPAGYEILGELGRGGMGVVYKARQLALQRIVALKMIRTGGGSNEEELRRFRREALAAARLQHPNIVGIHEIGEHPGGPYCVLEYVGGGNLAEHLAGKPQPPREASQLVETLARAVHYAHTRNIIHRDLKPANILM
jgi:serine/threonine protein kinase